jgi:hypothetical protein
MIRADYRDMHDDEKEVAKGYRKGQLIFLAAVLIPSFLLW